MESLLPIKADIDKMPETLVEVISPTSDTANLPTPATVERENNSLAPASIGNQIVPHSRHPMITRSYRQITGRRPLHLPNSSTSASIIRTPKRGTPKRTYKRRTPVVVRTPINSKSPKTPKTIGKPRVPAAPSASCIPETSESVQHIPGAVTRRRSLYDLNSEVATKRKMQESPEITTLLNPNLSEISESSPFKRTRYELTPSPRRCPNPIQTLSTIQSTVIIAEQMAEEIPEISQQPEGVNVLETDYVDVLGNPEHNEITAQDGLFCCGLANIPPNDGEEPTDPAEESINERTVAQPSFLGSIVNRFHSPASAVRATSDISYEDSSSERTLTPSSVTSDVSTSIDPEEIIEGNQELAGVEAQERTITKLLLGNDKKMCLLM